MCNRSRVFLFAVGESVHDTVLTFVDPECRCAQFKTPSSRLRRRPQSTAGAAAVTDLNVILSGGAAGIVNFMEAF